jgi:hypothetical protein
VTRDRDEHLMAALDGCLAALAAGESLESRLAAHPAQADELAGLLEVARALEAMRPPGPSAAETGRARAAFLEAVDRRAADATGLGTWIRRLLRPGLAWVPSAAGTLAAVAAVMAAVLLLSGGMVYASGDSLPGEPLYRVKLIAEGLERSLTVGNFNRLQLEERLAERREGEVQQLLALLRQEEVVFSGPLEETDDGRWRVDGVVVMVGSETEVAGTLEPGALVDVHGLTRADGVVMATRIVSAQEVIKGRVAEISTWRWRVGGKKVLISLETEVERGISAGDFVVVRARRFPSGTLVALTIEPADGEDRGSEEGHERGELPATPSGTARPEEEPSAAPAAAVPEEPREPAATSARDQEDEHSDDLDGAPAPPASATDEGEHDGEEGDQTPPAKASADAGEDDGGGDPADDGGDTGDDGGDDGEERHDGDDGEHDREEEEMTPSLEPTPAPESTATPTATPQPAPGPEPTEHGGDD